MVHVDDGIMAGTEEFLKHMRPLLRRRWTIENFSENDFKFCGLWIQKKRNGDIHVTQDKYSEMVTEIPMTRARAAQVTQKMTPKEIKEVQSVAGAANWMSTQTRPDLAFDVSELVGLISHDGTVQCIKKANKLVKKVKSGSESCLIFRRLQNCTLKQLRVVAYSDASWANMPAMKSQSGQVFCLAGETHANYGTNMFKNMETFRGNLIHWRSQRIKRVCRSTFAAETLSAIDAIDQGIYLRDMLVGWLNLDKLDEDGRPTIPLQLYSDCNSLCETLEMVEPKATEKRLRLDLTSMKENLDNGTLSAFTWLDTRIQVADVLTKHMDVRSMMKYLRYGHFPYWFDDSNDNQQCSEKYTSNQVKLRALMAFEQIKDVYGD